MKIEAHKQVFTSEELFAHSELWREIGPYIIPVKSPNDEPRPRLPEFPCIPQLRQLNAALALANLCVVDEDIQEARKLSRPISRIQSKEALTWLDRLIDAEGAGYWSPEKPKDIRKKFELPGYEVSTLPSHSIVDDVLGFYANRIVVGELSDSVQSETIKALKHAIRGIEPFLRGKSISIDNEVVIDASVNDIKAGVRRLVYFAMHGYNVEELRLKKVSLAITVCRKKNKHAMKAHALCGWRKIRWDRLEENKLDIPSTPYHGQKEPFLSKAGTEWDLLVLDPFSANQDFFVRVAPMILPLKIVDPSHLNVLQSSQLPRLKE